MFFATFFITKFIRSKKTSAKKIIYDIIKFKNNNTKKNNNIKNLFFRNNNYYNCCRKRYHKYDYAEFFR